jgi:two-component sensor histidine kinase/tetratricopeptide (TPR) repeat protein
MTRLRLAFLIVLAPITLLGQQSYYDKASATPDMDSAIFYVQKYIDQAGKDKDTSGMIEGSCFLARKLVMKSLYVRATKLIENCLSFHFIKKNPVYKAKLQLELGVIYRYDGSYAQSLTSYLEAKSIFEKFKEWRLLAKCEAQVAEYYRGLGKFKEANTFIHDALEDYAKNKLADTALLIYIYGRAAAIDNESNPDPMATVRNSRMALHLAIKSKNKNAEATSLNELGYSYKNIKKTDSAEILYKKAEDIWFSLGQNQEAIHAMNNRAMLYAHNNYPDAKVLKLYAEMINLVKTRNIDYPLNDAYGFLNGYYLRRGDSVQAYKYFYKYHESVIGEIRKQHDIQVTNITEKYESEKAKKEVRRMTGELSDSRVKLEQKDSVNKRMFFFISILVVFVVIIAVLLWRINKANRKLAERNKEKDVLIQEIHHRVKNNLQFISSLINMQMNSSVDDKEIHTLNDASRRIRAMALVHEMLYNHKESQGISIKQYLGELVLSLDQLVNSEKIPIEFKLNCDEQNFNVSDSIALGMITSELVSNSMKHAFKNVENPVIEVILQKKEKDMLFIVRDNGVGAKNVQEQKKTLGLRLIDIFSRQLKGKYSIASASGYSYQIQFTAR